MKPSVSLVFVYSLYNLHDDVSAAKWICGGVTMGGGGWGGGGNGGIYYSNGLTLDLFSYNNTVY